MLYVLNMCKFITKLEGLMGANNTVTLIYRNILSYNTMRVMDGMMESMDIIQRNAKLQGDPEPTAPHISS